MASTDKIEADAKRASTRGPGGYLADRALSRADFSKAPGVATTPSALPRGGADDEPAENGATRMLRRRMDSQEAEALGKSKDSYKAGGLVRRGYGKARGA